MPKEIKSSMTKKSNSVSNDRQLQQAYKHGEAPDPKMLGDYEQDLHTPSGSLERVANRINQK